MIHGNQLMKESYLFRHKIFIALLLINLFFLTIMAFFNLYQNKKNVEENRKQEFLRVESEILQSFTYTLNSEPNVTKNRDSIFQNKIFETASIFNTNINVYDLDGKLFASNLKQNDQLNKQVLKDLKNSITVLVIDSTRKEKNNKLLVSYDYIKKNNIPLAILSTQKLVDNTHNKFQLWVILKQYFLVIIFLMILSGFVAMFISKNLTKKIETIADKLKDTKISTNNQPIAYAYNDEIKPLVDSYNQMVEKIEEQTLLLQKTEREEAWKEMAKQVAHEINNPLTPLKLTIQNFHRKFRNSDEDNVEKVDNLTKSVIHQIDIISSITKSFSDFAKMPTNSDTEINVVKTISRTIDIFPESEVIFESNVEELFYKIDSLYLSRIVTNIVKNAIQSIPTNKIAKIYVILKNERNKFVISIVDNGNGVPEEFREKIFEPKFTTKSTGMGLGLSMVKKIVEDYKGKIWFETKNGTGTTFFVEFPK